MAIFYERREEIENGKKFLVLKAKPIPHIILISLVVITFLYYTLLKLDVFKSAKVLIYLGTIVAGILFLSAIPMLIEARGTLTAGFKNKIIIKKGKTTLSFSEPLEKWVEK